MKKILLFIIISSQLLAMLGQTEGLSELSLPQIRVNKETNKFKQVFYDKNIRDLAIFENKKDVYALTLNQIHHQQYLAHSIGIQEMEKQVILVRLLGSRDSFYSPDIQAIASYNNSFAFAREDNTLKIASLSSAEEKKIAISFFKIAKPHNEPIKRIRLGTTLLDNKPILSIASSSTYPTLRIQEVKEIDVPDNILKYEKTYLLDFNDNALVCAKKKSFFNFGNLELDIYAQFDVNFKNKNKPYEGAELICSLKVPAKKVYKSLLASVQGDKAAILYQHREKSFVGKGKQLFDFYIYTRGSQRAQLYQTEEKTRKGPGSKKMKLAQELKVKNIYLWHNAEYLIVVSNMGIQAYRIGQENTMTLSNKKLLNVSDSQRFDIQASAIHGNKLYFFHKDATFKGQDNLYRFFVLDLNTWLGITPESLSSPMITEPTITEQTQIETREEEQPAIEEEYESELERKLFKRQQEKVKQ